MGLGAHNPPCGTTSGSGGTQFSVGPTSGSGGTQSSVGND